MRRIGLALLAVCLAGCYHATIETGLAPSAQTIDRSWAAGWLYGLVPPSTTDTQQRCPNGVARIETQLSFANQLAAFITGYIYTPMSITVTCAEKARGGGAPEASAPITKNP
jgi:hypothetical protein